MTPDWAVRVIAAAARLAVRGLDALVRRASGIRAFTDDPQCLLRVAFRHSPYHRVLNDGTEIHKGDPVLELHFWNERLPRMGPQGPDMAWALRFMVQLRHSLRLLARYVATDPRARQIVAVYGYTYITWDERDPQRLMLTRLGFTFFLHPPPRTLWQRISRFFTLGYTWALVWTFNPSSLKTRTFTRERLVEVWMSRQHLLRYLAPKATAKARETAAAFALSPGAPDKEQRDGLD